MLGFIREAGDLRHLLAVMVIVGLLPLTVAAKTPTEGMSLIEAVKVGHQDRVASLLEDGVDVNAQAGDGSTALLWAAHRDELSIAELLLEFGADVNVANELGATPLWAASVNGNVEIVRRLIHAGADPNASLLKGETVLMAASRTGSSALTALLLEAGANPDARGPRGQTALMWAAAQRHADVVAELVAGGADVQLRSDAWPLLMAQPPAPHPDHQREFTIGGNSALMFAARSGAYEAAKLLAEAGADVNAVAGSGITALTMAVYSDFGTLIADTGWRDGGPFRLDGGREHPGRFGELAAFLLQQGADPNLGAGEFTALHAAILRRNEEMVAILVEHGADPNLPVGGWTPLQRVSNTDYYIHKAWVGAPPIWLAARFGTPEILGRLAAAGADVDVVHRGEFHGGGEGGDRAPLLVEVTTPLMAAVGMSRTGREWVLIPDQEVREQEMLEKAHVLVCMGADADFVDDQGQSALDGARAGEVQSLIEFLVLDSPQCMTEEEDLLSPDGGRN